MSLTRRHFLITSSATAASLILPQGARLTRRSPNDKLNIGVVGVANRGGNNLNGVRHENVVALCDIDDRYLANAKKNFAKAAAFNDFRKMLDKTKLDAVVVSTADHTHATIGLAAMERGHHLYCEKPLAWSVDETRRMTELAAEKKLTTQMGTQIHSLNNYRRVVELVRARAIGKIQEVHVWVGKSWVGHDRPKDTPKIPKHIHYDLWLGPAPHRPYHPTYLPARWRGWWDFGGGTLSDMACHHVDLPFWALELAHPDSVVARGPQVHPESAPKWIEVDYTFPARGKLPPVKLTWYHGGRRPKHFKEGTVPRWGDGTLFVGEHGMLISDYGRHALLPESKYKDYKRPDQSIANSIGHYKEWTQAIRGNGATTCPFDYSGPLSETAILGNVAFRTGEKLEWDAKNMKATNTDKAAQYIAREPRKGW